MDNADRDMAAPRTKRADGTAERKGLWLAMFKTTYCPVQSPDGLLLPVGVFGQGPAKTTTETLRILLEAANQ